MNEVILGIITLAILGGHFWYVREKHEETKKFVNALIAKNPEQMRDLDAADKVQAKVEKQEPSFDDNPDLVPLAGLSQDDFDQHIEEALNGRAN